MKSRMFFPALAVGLALLFSQCAKKNGNLVGVDFFDRTNIGAENYMEFYASPADTFYNHDLAAGTSQYLFIGSYEGLKARTLMRINQLNLPTIGTVDSATLILYTKEIHGDSSLFQQPKIYRINADWDDETITWSQFEQQGLLGQPIASTLLERDSSKIVISLPPDMIQSWMDTTIHDNFGICLSYDTETDGYIYKCTSRDYSGADSPSFNLYMSEDTTRWTNNISPTNDAFIATREQGAVSQRLLVADCGVLRSFLYFDISGIPEEATINRAVCTIHSDSLLGWPSYVNDFGLNLSLLEVPFDGSSDMAIYDDEILTANVNGDSANLLITNFVQAWSSQNKTNYGFLISGYTEDSDIYSQAFYSSEADSSLRPIMRVYYSLPPSSRLENQ